jgi:hypothetical protein
VLAGEAVIVRPVFPVLLAMAPTAATWHRYALAISMIAVVIPLSSGFPAALRSRRRHSSRHSSSSRDRRTYVVAGPLRARDETCAVITPAAPKRTFHHRETPRRSCGLTMLAWRTFFQACQPCRGDREAGPAAGSGPRGPWTGT